MDEPAAIQGKRVLVIEDGPTLTHGEMAYGAGYVAARRFGAAEIVDPRPFAVKSIAATYAEVSQDRPDPAGHGLRRSADERPGSHHQRVRTWTWSSSARRST